MDKQKLIIVSNRLPISVSKENGELVFTSSPGGLATAMSSLGGAPSKRLWIGWPGIASDELTPADRRKITARLRSEGCYPVFLTREQITGFYDNYSNETIWPLFHYFQAQTEYSEASWQMYKEVNDLFKKAVLKNAHPNATIWIHDYHLMLLPDMLRTQLPKSSIGFFLHIPFPSFELFRLLPGRKEIIDGLLGANLIGFHTYDYVRHFLNTVLRTTGYENERGTIMLDERTVAVDAFPIGIDYQRFAEAVEVPRTKNEIQLLNEHYKGMQIILSIDRLDYSKGITKRLEAFEQFLAKYPRFCKKVVLVVIAVPSRVDVEAYKNLRRAIEESVSRINGLYGTVDWTPISYQYKNLDFEQLVALYARGDVAMVTPLRDGMNLVAKEYVASKQNTCGVLILSELTGAIDELHEAERINPNDTTSIVHAMKLALTMPKKAQLEKLASMQKRLSSYTVQEWAADFIRQLELSKQAGAERFDKLLTANDTSEIVNSFKSARHRTLLLDYDGTLSGFVSSPKHSKAAPSKVLLKVLETLARTPNTKLYIISGRTREALDAWFGHLPLGLVAEHGFWVKQGDTWAQEDVSFKKHKQDVLEIMENYAARTPGAMIEEKNFSVVWHYRNTPPELAYARNASLRHDLRNLLSDSDVQVLGGSKIIEVKPHGTHKGTVVSELLFENQSDFVISIGDDDTDEDMFEVLPETAYSIKVGLGNTRARYQVPSVNKVLSLLKVLACR